MDDALVVAMAVAVSITTVRRAPGLGMRSGVLRGRGVRWSSRGDDFGDVAGRLGGRIGRHVLAERGHFDGLQSELHVRQAEPAADDPAVPEQPLDLVRVRVGRDVEVFRTRPSIRSRTLPPTR